MHPAPLFGVGDTRIGYGAAMRLEGQMLRGGGFPDPDRVHRVLRRACALGVRFIDTADSYGAGESESLIAAALRPYPDDLLLATKGGVVWHGSDEFRIDGRPEHLRRACDASLQRLGIEQIGLYLLHWVDPQVALAEQIGALKDLAAAGKIRHVGLCNVGVEVIQEASRIAPIAAVQNRFDIADQRGFAVVQHCAANAIAFVAHTPLGILRCAEPRIVQGVRAVAARHRATLGQIAIAWLLRRASNIIPIPGTITLEHLEENMRAERIVLSDADVAALAA